MTEEHIRTITKSRGGRNIIFYICPICKKQRTFMVLQNLKRHIKTFHNNGVDNEDNKTATNENRRW